MTWASERSPLPCNLIFIKVEKCASSTSGGVARRIAVKHNVSGAFLKTWVAPEPGLWANHGRMSAFPGWSAMARLAQPSFVWTMIRLPAPRCLSEYYHLEVSRARKQPSDERRVAKLGSTTCQDYVFRYLATGEADTPHGLVTDVYSFIGLVERYDESMVLLASLLRIPLTDVLYLVSKDSSDGNPDDMHKPMVPHPELAAESAAVRQFASGAAFNASNANDYALYAAASAQIDRLWQSNRAELDEQLKSFQQMRAEVTKECSHVVAERYAKSSSFNYQQSYGLCYWNDNGCGYKCIDSFVERRGRHLLAAL
jgi:hypothetical protein